MGLPQRGSLAHNQKRYLSLMDRENKRIKALEEYQAKKSRAVDFSASMDSARLEAGLQDFSMATTKKGPKSKVPARFARLHQQKIQAQEEEVKEKEAKLAKDVEQVDLATRLPSEIHSFLSLITENLEKGELREATTLLRKVKTLFSDESKYSSSVSVNLGLEHRIYQNTYAYRQGEENAETGHSYKKVHKFINLTVSEANPTLWSRSEKVSMREIIKAKKLSKQLEEGDFAPVTDAAGTRHVANVQAVIYNYFSTLQSFPMYVHNENAQDGAGFAELSLELGGFPLVDPVYEDNKPIESVQQISGYQRALIRANNYSCRENVFHLMAQKDHLDDFEQALLTKFLAQGSFQRINLWQKNYLGFEPLAVAISSRNIDFVQAVLSTEASFDMPWSACFNLTSYEFDKILVEKFTPPNQTEYAKMRQQIEQQTKGSLSRFQLLSSLLKALRQNLEMRVNSGKEDSQELLDQIKDLNAKTFNALNGRLGRDQMTELLQTMAKLHGTTLAGLQANFHRGKPCFEDELTLIEEIGAGLSPVDQIMLHSFNSFQLKSGYLIQQLCISATADEVSEFTTNVCPGLSHQLFQQVVPLLKIDEQLDSVQTEHFPIRFPFEDDSDFTYCYPLKLSKLYHSEDPTLDDLIVSKMDFEKMEPFLLEIICLIGLSMGTENAHFKTIFAKKPWLFGEQPPLFQHVKMLQREKAPAEVLKYYSLPGYIKMIITLGKVLIRNHEVDLFHEFFASQNCMYMNSHIVSQLLQEVVQYSVPECSVPIFALCSSDFSITNLVEFEKKQIDFQSNKSKKTVTEAQLQDALLINKTLIETKRVDLLALLKTCSNGLADKVVSLVLDQETYNMHVRGRISANSIRDAGNYQEACTLEGVHLAEQIYKQCSIDVATRFIQSMWTFKEGSTDLVKVQFLSLLLYLFSDTSNQSKMVQIKQKNHIKNFQKKMQELTRQQFKDAVNYPDQLTLIQRSVSEADLAAKIAGYVGIETSEYVKICQETLDYHASVLPRMQERYHYSEIASASSGAKKITDRDAVNHATATKIKAVLQTTPTREGMLNEVVEWQKFENVKHIPLAIIESSLKTQEMLDLLLLLVTRDIHEHDGFARKDEYLGSKPYAILEDRLAIFQSHYLRENIVRFPQSFKLLMAQPLIIKLLELTANNIFPFAEQVINEEKALIQQDQSEAVRSQELADARRSLRVWSIIYLTLLFECLNPCGANQAIIRVKNPQNWKYVEDVLFRASYISKLDSFTDEVGSVVTGPPGRLQQFMHLQYFYYVKGFYAEDAEEGYWDNPMRQIVPLVDNFAELSEEPVQKEVYMALFAQLPAVYEQLCGESEHPSHTLMDYFENLFNHVLPYTSIGLLIKFLQFEGTANIFKCMGLKQLNLILTRDAIPHSTKLLAIKRYLEVPSKSEDDYEQINLISFTNFFSDQYQTTMSAYCRVTDSAQMLFLNLIKSNQLYSEFAPDELPKELEDSCSDLRFAFLFLQTPPKDAETEDNYLNWLNFALSKIGKVDDMLHFCPRLFSWVSRVLFKGCQRGFIAFSNWFRKVHPQHKSCLEAEVESQDAKNKLLVDLISEGRYEIVELIKQMADGTTLWEELKVIRTLIGSEKKKVIDRNDQWMYYRNNDNWESSSDEEEVKGQAWRGDPLHFMALPCFAALGAGQFELCNSLLPDKSSLLEPPITWVESDMLATKLGPNSISSFKIKDPQLAQIVKDVEAEAKEFEGVQDLALIKLLRLMPNFDNRVFLQSVQLEAKMKKRRHRIVGNAFLTDAIQHVDIAIQYINLGLLDAGMTLVALLEKCKSKQELVNVLIAFFHNFDTFESEPIYPFVNDFRSEVASMGALKRSPLGDYLDKEFRTFKGTNTFPTLSKALFERIGSTTQMDQGPAGQRTVSRVITTVTKKVRHLLESTFAFNDDKSSSTFGEKDVIAMPLKQLQTEEESVDRHQLQDQIFTVAKFWLRVVKERNLDWSMMQVFESNEFKKAELSTLMSGKAPCSNFEVKRMERHRERKYQTVLWSMDLRTDDQMGLVGDLLCELVDYSPLIYNVDEQNFFFWDSYCKSLGDQEIAAKRAQNEYFNRHKLAIVQTDSDDLAMVSFIAKHVLKLGFFELQDRDDDPSDEVLVKDDKMAAMKTIYATLIAKGQKSDAVARIQRAQAILQSFSQVTKITAGSSLPIEISFSMNGQQLKLELNVHSLAQAEATLGKISISVAKIREIPEIPHVELYKRVFKDGHFYTTDSSISAMIEEDLQRALEDSTCIEELKRRNFELGQTFVFDGFFNKIVASFQSEYAVQFAEVAVDPSLDTTGLKAFLEEAMATPELATSTIESIFNSISWSTVEEVVTSECAFEIFSNTKLVITRCTKEEIVASSKDDFQANVARFRSMQTTGACDEADITLALCFDEESGKILINKNKFLPYLYVAVKNGSKRLMATGWQDSTKTINEPVMKADILTILEALLQTEGLVPQGTDFMTFVEELGLLAEVGKETGVASEVSEFAAQITREVTDCTIQHKVKKSSKVAFTYSKLAGLLVTFKILGEPSYPDQTIEFSYSDLQIEPYESYNEELAEIRPDLVMLGINHKQVREEQTNMFIQKGFTKRPKSIRSIVATIVVYCRIRKAPIARPAAMIQDEEEEKKE